jgi:hypothetical protein
VTGPGNRPHLHTVRTYEGKEDLNAYRTVIVDGDEPAVIQDRWYTVRCISCHRTSQVQSEQVPATAERDGEEIRGVCPLCLAWGGVQS